MGASEFHGAVDLRLDMCICHIKRFIRNFCSPYKTARNAIFFYLRISLTLILSMVEDVTLNLQHQNILKPSQWLGPDVRTYYK